MEVLQRQERELDWAKHLTSLKNNSLAGSMSAISDVGLIRRSPAQQTIERVMLSVNPKTKPGYIHLICYTLNSGFNLRLLLTESRSGYTYFKDANNFTFQ